MILAARSLSSQLIVHGGRLTHAAVSLSRARLPPQPARGCPQRVTPSRQSRRTMPRAGPEKAAGSFWCLTARRSSSGSLAMLAAMRRASSLVSRLGLRE